MCSGAYELNNEYASTSDIITRTRTSTYAYIRCIAIPRDLL